MDTGERSVSFTPRPLIKAHDLTLRPYVRDDARELMEAVTESIEHLRPWMPWIQFEPQDIHDKRKLIRTFSDEWQSRTSFTMGIFRGDRLVGGTGFHVRGPHDSLEIGYWVRAGHTRQRVATRATSALLDEAFRQEVINRVFINHDAANVASQGVPETLGFTLVATETREPLAPGDSGVLKRWVMNRDDWQIMKQGQ